MASATVTTSLHSHRASFSAAGGLPHAQTQSQSQQAPAPTPSPSTSSAQLAATLPPSHPSHAPHLSASTPFDHSSSSLSGVAQMPSASQQSQSSQQSFAMNSHPSQQAGPLSASGYRPFAESSQPKTEEDDPMKIYSVCHGPPCSPSPLPYSDLHHCYSKDIWRQLANLARPGCLL